jgi:hypothetical protein
MTVLPISSFKAMPTKKPRNPDHVRRRNTPLADNEAISEHGSGHSPNYGSKHNNLRGVKK